MKRMKRMKRLTVIVLFLCSLLIEVSPVGFVKVHASKSSSCYAFKDESNGVDMKSHWFAGYGISNALALMGVGTSAWSEYVTRSTMESDLMNREFVIFSSHGGYSAAEGGYVCCSDRKLYPSRIDTFKQFSCSQADLVIYACCHSGNGGMNGTNVVNSTYNRGAKHVIGFTTEVGASANNYWIKYFVNALGDDKTIESAQSSALFWVRVNNWGSAGNCDNIFIRGGTSTTF